MKVKIGDRIYNSKEQPILLILDATDKINISNMDKDKHKFCSYPKGIDIKDIKEFMSLNKK